MADISTSAAKTHVLSGSGDVQRISGPASQLARDLGHKYLKELGRVAAEEANNDKRKTIMPQDLEAAAKKLCGDSCCSQSAPPAADAPTA